jgi:glucosamine 6-phosphate synthetase-like amidotransferase/phosphosugar isomerase protein
MEIRRAAEGELKVKEIEKLVANANPKARVPKGFALWSEAMIIAWLRSHQKVLKTKKEKV